MDTWGISGPRFLFLYLVLGGITALLMVVARRRALAGPGEAAIVPARLDPYEAAYLNGGSELVATTAVSSLLRAGVLTTGIRRHGQVRLQARNAPAAGVHPVEWATYELVAAQSSRPLRDLPGPLGRSPALAAVRERLRRGGLVPTPEQRNRYRATALLFGPLLALGTARLAAGTAGGRPVGFLAVLLAVTAVLAVVLCLRVPHATGLGRRTLRRLRAETRRPAVGASASELGMSMALYGACVLWGADADTAAALRVPREHSGWGGIGGGDGGGGGGGCGGGGCGG